VVPIKNYTKKILIFFIALLLLTGGTAGITVVNKYEDRVLPNVYIGEYNFGGMKKDQVVELLQSLNDNLASKGILIKFKDKSGEPQSFELNPLLVLGSNGGNTIELISFDPKQEAENLIAYGKGQGYLNLVKSFTLQLNQKKEIKLSTLELDRKRIKGAIQDNVTELEQQPQNASLEITSIEPLEYEIKESKKGYVYEYDKAISEIKKDWEQLNIPEVELTKTIKNPEVKASDLDPLVSNLDKIFANKIIITYDEKREKEKFWEIKPEQFKDWIEPKKRDGKAVLSLNKTNLSNFVEENISDQVKRPAKNAEFEVKEKIVTKFNPSQTGKEVDIQKNLTKLEKVIQTRMESEDPQAVTNTIKLAVKKIEPDTKISDVNNLGIEAKLGTGVSNFAGSPANRIHNIQVGSSKLDGLLIAPGEEFSAVKSTRPYTKAAGYLPELVIKGEELKPELGGGLCQLGTTLFRMAMESGMPITERRNHSLVVNYYSDPVNGLPGTDATLYNPKPDFRFKNNTGNHLLVDTEVDVTQGKLYYTLWGKDDGRSSSTYTHPSVSNWYQPGPEKTKETTSLPPGKTKCQKKHVGADASFTYKRVLPDGSTKERVFTSHYKPLPRICLKGVKKEEKKDEEEDKKEKNNKKATQKVSTSSSF